MIRSLTLLAIGLCLIFLSCPAEETFYYSNISGYIKDSSLGAGVNGIIVDIFDYEVSSQGLKARFKGSDTTETNNSNPGFYKMDGVCYGSSKSIFQIGVKIDSTKNPLYHTIQTYQSVVSENEVLRDIYIRRR